ncbi:hypothetical protein [uncultured Nocardioides sp.]|uniref:hypothetical protein n=1 Tax=uncultured Nocardioides sp. TaxID=198441 RepID=UPI00262521B8|nr:hypothetical protein [uncultured Nocardioides sp.]
MSDHQAAAGEVASRRLKGPRADETPRRRSVLATAWSAVTAVVGGIMGLLPHLLHHVGLLGGAVLVTGATGNVVFAVLGLVLSLPMLRRLYRRFGTWKAPALALTVFTLMFSLSAFVIGPAINNDQPEQGPTPVKTPSPDDHEGHHGG